MKSTLTRPADSVRTLEIHVESDKVKDSYNKLFKKYSRDVAVPGFRKGKVPRPILERHMQPEFLKQGVLEDIGLSAYQEGLKEHGLLPLTQPNVEWVQFEKDQEMIFRATFEVKPEIEVPEYKGLTVQAPKVEVSDEDVDKLLEQERQKRQRVVSVDEDRGLQRGDLATVNFESFIAGEAVPGGKADNFLMEVNDEFFLPGFADNLLELKKGEEKRFSVQFPAEYQNPTLAGKEVEFAFLLSDIKKREVPALDDEFAREVSRFPTLDEMRQEVRNQLERDLRSSIANLVLDQLAASTKIDLPRSLLHHTSHQILLDWEKQLQSVGLTLSQYLERRQMSVHDLEHELEPRAIRVALNELLVDAIAKKEDMSISAEEVEQEIDRFARMTNQDTSVVRETMEGEGTLPYVQDNLLRRKVMDLLHSVSTIEKSEEPAETSADEDAAEDAGSGEKAEAASVTE